MIEVGSIIQVNEKVPGWNGCLLVVDEVKPYGCQAALKIPNTGVRFINLLEEQYEYVGETEYMKRFMEDMTFF